ncbi:TSUP family transporter [Alicyclobacillus suci]|uniref:TSUP family transporter n=1 Tax=Alicyclobacillus suci TaxID=2816080 RepID=UPI001F35A81D|nr:TSUP family transporter [Alicyclobacillus suci]
MPQGLSILGMERYNKLDLTRKGRINLLHAHHPTIYIILAVSGLLSGFIDSTVGGGGLISLPALLFVGFPPAAALGTNKLAGTMGSLTSTLSYLRSGKVTYRIVLVAFPLAVLGGATGAVVVHHLPSSFLRPLVLILLILVAGYTFWNKRLGLTDNRTSLTRSVFLFACLAALVVGFYDGFFGPGTGSFFMMIFVLLGFNFVNASGNARTLNFGTNLGALGAFVTVHAVDYLAGIILGAGMVIGAIIGSQFAIRRGAKYVRPLFIGVTCFVILQQLYTLISP